VHRGDVITLAEFGGSSATLDVAVEVSPRANRAIRDGAQVHVHHGSANIRAKVALSARKELAPGERTLAQLKLEASVFAFAGDRFIFRDSSGQNTAAGGVVLDADPVRKSLRSEARLRFLRERAEAPGDATSFVVSQVGRDRAVRQPQLLVKSNFSAQVISSTVSSLTAEKNLVLAGEFAVDAAWWKSLYRRGADSIDANHRAHPEQSGLSLSDLRTSLDGGLPFPELFEFLVNDLCGTEFVKVGNTIRRVTHRRALPPPLLAAAAKLRSALAAKPFDPPSLNHLAPDSVSQTALRFLIDTGEAVEISPEVVLATENWKRMTELIRQYIRNKGPSTVSQLRQELGCSRRVIVPALERLDRDGVTMRNGDARTLRAK
jgi:selenocysteine-specific elongation factor